MNDVTFEYWVNGERIKPDNLTLTAIDKVFGSAEYSIAAAIPDDEEINELQVIVRAEAGVEPYEKKLVFRPCPHIPLLDTIGVGVADCLLGIPKSFWNQTRTEKFMEKLWAFKRINYLLGDQNDCTKGIDRFTKGNILETTSDDCKKEAIELAIKYNFVTDVTSMVVEEDDIYTSNKPVEVAEAVIQNDYNDYGTDYAADYDSDYATGASYDYYSADYDAMSASYDFDNHHEFSICKQYV